MNRVPDQHDPADPKSSEASLETLVSQLRDPDWVVSQTAAEQLVHLGQVAVPTLIQELSYPEGEVRRRAAHALGQLRAEQAVKPLIEVLDEDEDKLVRWAAAVALGELADSSAIHSLITALSAEWQTATAASHALVQTGEPAVEPLLNVLFHEDCLVRRQAADALSAIAHSQATQPLIMALGDTDSWVRSSAAEGLGAIGDRSAVDALIGALQDEDSEVRGVVAVALGDIGDARALAALEQLGSDTGATWDDRSVAEVALEAIERVRAEQLLTAKQDNQEEE